MLMVKPTPTPGCVHAWSRPDVRCERVTAAIIRQAHGIDNAIQDSENVEREARSDSAGGCGRNTGSDRIAGPSGVQESVSNRPKTINCDYMPGGMNDPTIDKESIAGS